MAALGAVAPGSPAARPAATAAPPGGVPKANSGGGAVRAFADTADLPGFSSVRDVAPAAAPGSNVQVDIIGARGGASRYGVTRGLTSGNVQVGKGWVLNACPGVLL